MGSGRAKIPFCPACVFFEGATRRQSDGEASAASVASVFECWPDWFCGISWKSIPRHLARCIKCLGRLLDPQYLLARTAGCEGRI